jgi:hypothetical protein
MIHHQGSFLSLSALVNHTFYLPLNMILELNCQRDRCQLGWCIHLAKKKKEKKKKLVHWLTSEESLSLSLSLSIWFRVRHKSHFPTNFKTTK